MAIEMEITDQGHPAAPLLQRLSDHRHRFRSRFGIDAEAHQLGTGRGQFGHLLHTGLHVRGVRVGHGLHNDRGATADRDLAHPHPDGGVPLQHRSLKETLP